MDFNHYINHQRNIKSKFSFSLFIVCIALTLSSPTLADSSYKVLKATNSISASQLHPKGNRVRSFTSKSGVSVYGNTDQARVDSFLQLYANDFSKSSKPANYKLIKNIKKDRLGHVTAKYKQSVAGINVTGSYMNINLKDDKVKSVFSSLIDEMPNELALSPTLTANQAATIARNHIGKQLQKDMSSAHLSKPVLELFNWGVLGNAKKSTKTKLTWYIELTSKGVREQVWIDAHSGILINRVNNIHSAKNRAVYDAQDSSISQNILVRAEGDLPANDVDADSAYDFSGDAYDYFFNEHALDSFDGQGSTVISNVHFCSFVCPEENAFWDGFQMSFGEGFATDDIVAHELTHAVIENSANLIYQDQSGALNESYADIFGEIVDLNNGAGNDAPSQRWLIGEDLSGFGVLRSMDNPGLLGDPATVSDPNFICDPFFDNGGVHINSGIPNKAFSLMVDGGSFNGFTVSPIGLDKAGKIHYRALSTYLGLSSTFLDNYNSLTSSCEDLIGTSGITVNDCAQVVAALDAVEMNGEVCFIEPPQPLELTGFCPENTTPTNYFVEGFENINANNLTTTLLVGQNMWDNCQGSPSVYCNDEPNSGNFNLSGDDISQVSDSVVTLPPFTVRSDSFFSFDHKYSFESSFDGAVVEYSINGGTSWLDALTLHSNGLNYNQTISTSFSSPLSGRNAFTGQAENNGGGYLRTILDLSSLNGETIQFRFRIGTDSSVSGFNGWRVDDTAAYQCSSNQGSDILDFLPAILKAASER